MTYLQTETKRVALIKERLLSTHEDLDEQTLADTLEGLSDINEMIAATIRSALDDESIVSALKSRLDALKTRLDRFQARARSKREACAAAMSELGHTKLSCEDMTVTLRQVSRRVEVTDESKVPSAFWRTPDPVLDRKGLGDALKSGVDVSGACLIDGAPSLTVRVR